MKVFYSFIVCFLAFLSLPSKAQQSGRLYYRNGKIQEVREFTKLQTELYYFHPKKSSANKEPGHASLDFIRKYPLENIINLTFKFEMGSGTDQFCYKLLIEGITDEETFFRKKIQTWDWLEISSPENNSPRNTEIIFFTEKKRLNLVKVEFDKTLY